MIYYINQLKKLKAKGRLRSIPSFSGPSGMINLSSNDYLGLAENKHLQKDFLEHLSENERLFSSSSARLLSGNFEAHEKLEAVLETLYNRPALTFNSGYHANVGILPALSDKRTLILSDKLVHASLIDGIRLSAASHIRFRHNDYEQLERLVETHEPRFERIIIVTESIFSMDGDEADLLRLTALKHRYTNIMLYVDEAHAVGVRGNNGLGCAEEKGCLADIDIFVGVFGKAMASMGAYVVCHKILRDYLINTMRPFIFSTALPPVTALWSAFILTRLPEFKNRRTALQERCEQFRTAIGNKGNANISASHIVPFIVGDSISAVGLSEQLQKKGFYVLPIRPPTVPEKMARLRFSLTASISKKNIELLAKELLNNL